MVVLTKNYNSLSLPTAKHNLGSWWYCQVNIK